MAEIDEHAEGMNAEMRKPKLEDSEDCNMSKLDDNRRIRKVEYEGRNLGGGGGGGQGA